MAKIKVAELFYSLQGEGFHLGVPSVFLRTFGCNFTCDGFGMPRGERSTERDDVAKNIALYPHYKSLPLVSTGCDSYASWDPRFKDLSPVLTVEAIVDGIQQMLPNGKFGEDKHLIITGGEPLLGWQRSYPALFDEINKRDMNLTDVTFETNGTQKLSDDLLEYLDTAPFTTTWSISAKLPCSGEKWEDAIQPDVVRRYLDVSECIPYFKFVVATQQDIDDAQRAIEQYVKARIDIAIYFMPVGGVDTVYALNERQVADFALHNGYRFSPRLQVPLYKNAWGT